MYNFFCCLFYSCLPHFIWVSLKHFIVIYKCFDKCLNNDVIKSFKCMTPNHKIFKHHKISRSSLYLLNLIANKILVNLQRVITKICRARARVQNVYCTVCPKQILLNISLVLDVIWIKKCCITSVQLRCWNKMVHSMHVAVFKVNGNCNSTS